MSSIPYLQRSAPFWDWVSSLEEQGSTHPFFGGPSRGTEGPWGPQNAFPFRMWPFDGSRPFPHRGPPPPAEAFSDDENGQSANEQAQPSEKEPLNNAKEKGENFTQPASNEHTGRRHGHHPHRHSHYGHRRGGYGGRHGGRHGFPDPFFFFRNNTKDEMNSSNEVGDFKPRADVFDTQTSYVIHVSLPGAQKEDVAVNWDTEKSEVIISGVIYRPGSEEFLKTLALNERKVGAFERKIRLGSPAHPAAVDINGMTAKLEDGVLRVEIPKEDKEFVNVMKVVDVE